MPTRLLKARVVALLGGACSRCGYSRCHRALQLHHLDPTTKNKRIHHNTILRQAQQHPELFVLLCANCHFEEHEAQDLARKPTLTCNHCRKEYKVGIHVAKLGRSRFCSRRCFANSLIGQPSRKPPGKWATLSCQHCDQPYKKREYVAKTGRSHYCSRLCQRQHQITAARAVRWAKSN